MRIHTHLLVTGLTLLLVTPALQAQTLHEHTPIPPEQLAKGQDLFRRAEALMATCDQEQWKEAAKLFEEAAGLLPCHDPKVYEALFQAAEIANFTGDARKAHRFMKEAAEHAMHVGDLEHAVDAYVQAAYLAADLGDRDRAVTYVAMAEDLSHSPLLGAKGPRLQSMIAEHFTKSGGGR
ncbi:MAG: hypothetical protein P8170_12805 [Gemmatimonadota bacterium]|jgi:tetratricopeptide (TPR) repeat protein